MSTNAVLGAEIRFYRKEKKVEEKEEREEKKEKGPSSPFDVLHLLVHCLTPLADWLCKEDEDRCPHFWNGPLSHCVAAAFSHCTGPWSPGGLSITPIVYVKSN